MSPRSWGYVRLRSAGHERGKTALLTVPEKVAKLVPLGTEFHVELVEEGILFRFHETPDEKPEWLKKAKTRKR